MPDPSPMTMLIEGARDTVAALKLMRLGALNDVPMKDALGMINVHIDQLEYAVSAALDTKESD